MWIGEEAEGFEKKKERDWKRGCKREDWGKEEAMGETEEKSWKKGLEKSRQ